MADAVLRDKFTALNVYIKKKKRILSSKKIQDPTSRKYKKEEQNKIKAR